MPNKRYVKRTVTFLDADETAALLTAPDRTTWAARTDLAIASASADHPAGEAYRVAASSAARLRLPSSASRLVAHLASAVNRLPTEVGRCGVAKP